MMGCKHSSRLPLLFLCVLGLGSLTAHAAEQTFSISGEVRNQVGSSGTPLTAGTPFTGFYSFDDAATDTNPDPDLGQYSTGRFFVNFGTAIGNILFDQNGRIGIRNDQPQFFPGFLVDSFSVSAGPGARNTPGFGNAIQGQGSVSFGDSGFSPVIPDALSGDDLTAVPQVLGAPWEAMGQTVSITIQQGTSLGDINCGPFSSSCFITMDITSLAEGFTLTVIKEGTGSGTITTALPLIDCGPTCQAIAGGTVVLTATPDPGTIFEGWKGCTSVAGTECTVNMTSARTVEAIFTIPPTLTLTSSSGILAEAPGSATDVFVHIFPAPLRDADVILFYSGSAGRGADYTGPDKFTVPAGSLQETLQITSLDDALVEGDEVIGLTGKLVHGGDTDTTAIILHDDDVPPDGGDGDGNGGEGETDLPVANLSVDNTELAENGGTVTVTASLDSPASSPVTLNFAFSENATRDADYMASAESLTIPMGASSASLTLSGIDDSTTETDESIGVTLTGADNATIGATDMVSSTIIDDDGAPIVNLSAGSDVIGENAGSTPVTATLSNPSSQNVIVNLATGGAATNGTDYSLGTTSLSIPAGSTTIDTTITGLNDAEHEPDELVVLAITSVDNADIGNPAGATVALTDDDEPQMGEAREDQTGPVTDTGIAAGQRQVPMLAFGLTNPGTEPALLDMINASLSDPDAPVALTRLYLDSNGDGQIQDGEPLIAETASVDPDGTIVFNLSAPLTINGGQTLSFVVTVDAAP